MESLRLGFVLLAGALLISLSSCNAARIFQDGATSGEDFSDCSDKVCFLGLKFTRPIHFDRQADSSERVVFVTWSGAAWKNNRFENMQEPLYLYFEVYFDANGLASNIRVGEPLCTIDDDHQRTCKILSASEINT